MSRSPHPAVLVVNVLLIPLGLAMMIAGIVGALSGEVAWAFALLAVTGLGVLAGGAWATVGWARSLTAGEDETRAIAATENSSAPEPVLARWTYDTAEWRAYAANELRFRTREALGMAGAVAGLGTVLLGVLEGEWGLAAGVSGTVGSAIGVGRWLTGWSAYRHNLSVVPGEVIVRPNAVVVNGRSRALEDRRTSFGAARVVTAETPAILEITIQVPGRYRRLDEECRVPIPAGREAEAAAVADALYRAHGKALPAAGEALRTGA